MSETADNLEKLVKRGYEHGFVTEIESDTVPPGLDEDVVRLISRKKREPAFLTEWRLKALRHWQQMREPHWAHVKFKPIDYQAIRYYSAPKTKSDGPRSLEEVDPELLKNHLVQSVSYLPKRLLGAYGIKVKLCEQKPMEDKLSILRGRVPGRRDTMAWCPYVVGGGEVLTSHPRPL